MLYRVKVLSIHQLAVVSATVQCRSIDVSENVSIFTSFEVSLLHYWSNYKSIRHHWVWGCLQPNYPNNPVHSAECPTNPALRTAFDLHKRVMKDWRRVQANKSRFQIQNTGMIRMNLIHKLQCFTRVFKVCKRSVTALSCSSSAGRPWWRHSSDQYVQYILVPIKCLYI